MIIATKCNALYKYGAKRNFNNVLSLDNQHAR